MTFGELLDRKMAMLVRAQQRRSGNIAAACLLGFVINTALTGAASVLAPHMASVFAYSGVLLLIGAVSNGLLYFLREKRQ